MRTQEAKVIEEKAAKIKDWVTVKLREVSSDMQSQSLDSKEKASCTAFIFQGQQSFHFQNVRFTLELFRDL